ncbi:hypothetical protein CHUAL_012451 [Chamberlinius hualienensis]
MKNPENETNVDECDDVHLSIKARHVSMTSASTTTCSDFDDNDDNEVAHRSSYRSDTDDIITGSLKTGGTSGKDDGNPLITHNNIRINHNNNKDGSSGDGFKVGITIQQDNEPLSKRSRDYDVLVLSAIYAKLLVVLGIGLPLSEVISPLIPSSFYVGFYLYLYFGCIAFLIYSYLFLMRRKGIAFHSFQSIFNRKVAIPPPNHTHVQTGAPKSCGSFYLRVGAIAFGIGSMIYSGLEFVQFFEFDPNSSCYNVIYGVAPIAQLIFTFAQLYFIFLNSKMRTYKYKNIARFGLMHMVATNLCGWLLSVIQESKFEIQRLTRPNILEDNFSGQSMSSLISPNNSTLLQELPEISANSTGYFIHRQVARCRRMRVLGQLVQNISPLLFPCSIQYSLICAAICYIMWKNIKRPKRLPLSSSPDISNPIARRHHHHYRVDCTGSIKGLFTGILVLVLVIISVILYFVLINKPEYRSLAIVEGHISEMILYIITTPIPILAMMKIRKFRYNAQKNVELDNILLIFAQVGVYLFSIFSMISGHLSPHAEEWQVVIGASVARLVQATIQTLFILDASHRTARKGSQAHKTPGRELITLLLVCNFSMWIISTLETGRTDAHPLQLKFYGFWGWTIISRFCTPLAIFFRFHSTVCLCEIWKKLYKRNRT